MIQILIIQILIGFSIIPLVLCISSKVSAWINSIIDFYDKLLKS